MEKFIIEGSKKLYGKVEIQSAKNSILPLISASIINEGVTRINRCKKIRDVLVMCEIIKRLGGKASFDGDTLVLDTSTVNTWRLPEDLTGEIRASLFTVGALLSRFKYASFKMPGGCNIGERPIDIHLSVLRALGATVKVENEITINGKGLKNADIYLSFPSVGATENAMLTAVCVGGETVIRNCAKEPEILDLQKYLNLLGAKVYGAGTDAVTVIGRKGKYKRDIEITPVLDRIEFGTFLFAVASTGGEISFDGENLKNSQNLLKIFKNNACKIYNISDNIYNIEFSCKLNGFGKITTGPHPSFATDLQPQLVACASVCDGLTVVEEKVFPKRFSYADQLKSLGAKVSVFGNACVVEGGRLHGGEVNAGDLRGGASLVIGGLSAEGKTVIRNVSHIDRGYYKLEEKLVRLGATVKRESY